MTTSRLEEIGELTAEVSHELRGALATIANVAFAARQRPADESHRHFETIEKHARRAQEIVHDVLMLAESESITIEPLDWERLLRVAEEGIGAQFTQRVEAGEYRGHAGLVTRLLVILYENAAHAAAPNRAAIETRVSREGSGTVVTVTDNGPGVPDALRESLFLPLTTGRKGGIGLGLALAKRIAHAHGGTITLVPSQRGATFRIEWHTR